MLIERRSDAIRIKAPAKLNLFLEVLGKRADGFHEIESLMCPISLCDTIEVSPGSSNEVELVVQFPEEPAAVARTRLPREEPDPAWLIPSDSSNLVVKAVECVRAALGIEQGCKIRLTKEIPAAAGLGGGSSDAAAAVVASMLMWDRWDRSLADSICARLGSDLNVFLGDENQIGLTAARGRGEICEVMWFTPELHFIVTHPPAGCATKAVYANWHGSSSPKSMEPMLEACKNADHRAIGSLLFNALESSARKVTPWVDEQLSFFSAFEFGIMR